MGGSAEHLVILLQHVFPELNVLPGKTQGKKGHNSVKLFSDDLTCILQWFTFL